MADSEWFPIYDGEIEVRVKPQDHPSLRVPARQFRRRYGKAIDRGLVSREKLQQLDARYAADNLLIDWRNLHSDGRKLSGDPDAGLPAVEFSREAARTLLERHRWLTQDVYAASRQAAEQVDVEDAEEDAEELGNG